MVPNLNSLLLLYGDVTQQKFGATNLAKKEHSARTIRWWLTFQPSRQRRSSTNDRARTGFEYRCELEPLWLPADLVKEVQMGCIHVRSYEKGLVRAARLDTLRKRKHSQM
jgi:hypothetical protein